MRSGHYNWLRMNSRFYVFYLSRYSSIVEREDLIRAAGQSDFFIDDNNLSSVNVARPGKTNKTGPKGNLIRTEKGLDTVWQMDQWNNKFSFLIKYYIYSRRHFYCSSCRFLVCYYFLVSYLKIVAVLVYFTFTLVLGILTLSIDSLIAYKNQYNQQFMDRTDPNIRSSLFERFKNGSLKKSQSVLERERYNDLMDYYTL